MIHLGIKMKVETLNAWGNSLNYVRDGHCWLLVPSTDLGTVPPAQDVFTVGRMGTDATVERGRPRTHPRWRRAGPATMD